MLYTIVFDAKPMIDWITGSHRLSHEELEDIIRYTYIEMLREYHHTPFLFRYQHNELDADIWQRIPITSIEWEIANEVLSYFYPIIVEQFEYISLLRYHQGLARHVFHIHHIELRHHNLYIQYRWE